MAQHGSSDLAYQLREAQAKISQLQVSLTAREHEAAALRDLADAASEMQAQDVQAAKIIDLAKKNRTLNLSLERERQKVVKLQSDLARGGGGGGGASASGGGGGLDAEAVEEIARSMVAEAQEAVEAAQKDANMWKERTQQQTNKMAQLEQKVFTLEIEVKKLTRALVREVGEETPLSKVLEEGSDWKGRREQLIALRDQVKQLKAAQGQPVADSRQDAAAKAAIGKIGNARSAEQDRLSGETAALRGELEAAKSKCDMAISRRKVIENELASFKEKVAVVLGKSQNDDKLVVALKAEVAALRKAAGGAAATAAAAAAGAAGRASPAGGSGSSGVADKEALDEAWREVSTLRRAAQEAGEQIDRQQQIIRALQSQSQKASPPAGALEAQLRLTEAENARLEAQVASLSLQRGGR